ncbi:MAG TPA: LON peptidase substrate-binding domain-containing protein [Terriglobales bacterium]|nr:LON peptidase substrate-binding domain-containing protein [Terriglobales bacterium]
MPYNDSVPLIALFPLDVVLLPGAPMPLHIFEERYKEMVGQALLENQSFGIVRAQEGSVAEIGCLADISEVVKKYDDGRLDIVTEGSKRFQIEGLDQERAFLRGDVTFFDDDEATPAPKPEAEKLIELHGQLLALAGAEASGIELDDAQLSFHLAGSVPLDLDFKQSLLAMKSEPQRVTAMIEYYTVLVPRLKRTLRVKEKSRGNGHAM